MPRKTGGGGAGGAAGRKSARKRAQRPSPERRTKGLTPGLSLGSVSPGGSVRVKQVRSGIGHAATYRRTLRALGLRHYQHEVVLADTPTARGMLRKVWHLVRVEAGEK